MVNPHDTERVNHQSTIQSVNGKPHDVDTETVNHQSTI